MTHIIADVLAKVDEEVDVVVATGGVVVVVVAASVSGAPFTTSVAPGVDGDTAFADSLYIGCVREMR